MDAENERVQTNKTNDAPNVDDASRARKLIYRILIVVALGVGFGKIVGVDSVPDRTIQNYRMAQIPKTLEAKAKELKEKNVSEEKFNAELTRVYNSLLRDANKARPTLSANDRSRWATIRALVEKDARVYRYVPRMSAEAREKRVAELNKGRVLGDPVPFKYYQNEIFRNCESECPEKIDSDKYESLSLKKELVPYAIDKAWETPGWESIDVVKHGLKDEVYAPEDPASGYIYSSKPTLLPTVMAVPYWVLNRCFGMSLAKRPFETTRLLLVFYNLIPLALAFLCLASTIDSIGTTDWGRFFAVGAALFATFALTFVATLNNHVPGFACISIALWSGMKILRGGETKKRYFILAGFFGAFAVACELPALAFAALLCLVLCVKRPKQTALYAVPAGLIVAIAFCATNYVAHQSIVPAYAHKRDHMALAQEAQKTTADETAAAANDDDAQADSASLFDPKDWYYYNYYPSGKTREPKNARLCHWAERTGIDRGEPSVARYAFHSTIGSRGIFSLTPVWIFSVVGLVALLFKRGDDARGLRVFAAMGLILTVVFFVFFMTRDQGDRNYGGMSCCPRWFFPLAPIFATALLPVADRLARSKVGRAVAYAALFWSVASAFFPTWSPWVSPWLYDLAVEWNWMKPY